MNFSRHNLVYFVVVIVVAVALGVFLIQKVGLGSINSTPDNVVPGDNGTPSGGEEPTAPTPTITRLDQTAVPTPSIAYVPVSTGTPTLVPPVPVDTATPTPIVTTLPLGAPVQIYLPVAPEGGVLGNPTATPVPVPTSTIGPTIVPPTPTPTRGPLRVTKLGLGIYISGGGMLPLLDQARPSVILLMDPTVDFAQTVRQHFPKAFIIGRIFATSQPLDNPAVRGAAFADQVAGTAVPLKGVVDAWMSYNEVAAGDQPATLIAYNTFQVAFANRLQNYYGIPAVAGNDGPRSVPAELYPQYFADAIRASKYFGVHVYPNADIKSLQDPNATDQVFYYRKIHDALTAAGIQPGPFIMTEVGLYNGWRGVESDTAMGNDFTWFAGQLNNDPYVLGMTVFGVLNGSQWANFTVDNSNILQIMGSYNTAQQ